MPVDNILPADLLEARGRIRAHMRRLRATLPLKDAAERSLAAQKRVLAQDVWKQARSVALYVSVRGEIATRILLNDAWASGREVWLPRVCPDRSGEMVFARCPGWEYLRPGSFGLLEPEASLPGYGPRDTLFAPECMLLPGLAFDHRGGRLGQGGGYYDRFLAEERTCVLIGLCFDFQLVDCLPQAPWDRPVQRICTEERELCP